MENKTFTVFIIDDEQDSIDMLTDLLQDIPGIYIAGSFRDPEEGIAALTANTPDILFLDIEMPGMYP
ncbi:MAG: response regulator, partial [Bacteroidetes bacterium]|nr:response regulator [Bacteroidota bacterium]